MNLETEKTNINQSPPVTGITDDFLAPVENTSDMEIEYDESFSYDGFQVVRGEFFAHLHEPALTFNSNKVYVNTACIKKLPETSYVQLLINPDEKKVCIRPCDEGEKDSFRWKTNGKKKTSPKQITCRIFFAKVMSLMNWNPSYRYKLLGKLIKSGGELLFIFELSSAETFKKTETADGKIKSSRTPVYPEEWKNQFGLTVDEHRKSMQVDIFDGYTVFKVADQEKKATDSDENVKTAKTGEPQGTSPGTSGNESVQANSERSCGNPGHDGLTI